MDKTEIIIFIILTSVIIAIFFAGVFIFLLQYKRRRAEHLKEKEALTQKHMAELLATQLEMQTQTMQYIGREIHDNIGQKLTLASLYTQQLTYENKAPQINNAIENIGAIINESLAELRQLSKSLTDDNINDNNIIELLQQECGKVNNLKKCNVTFNCNKENIALSYQTKSILLRIVQEFLQNSIKHAACKNVQVILNREETVLQLLLTDDGKGFDITAVNNKGIGLTNIKKRTALIGGTCDLESKAASGTQLNITLPL